MTKLADARFQAALSDRYIFDRVLGSGGMGTVFLARDVKHGRQVAIKALSPEVIEDVGERQFSREIRVTAQLQHPHPAAERLRRGGRNAVLRNALPQRGLPA